VQQIFGVMGESKLSLPKVITVYDRILQYACGRLGQPAMKLSHDLGKEAAGPGGVVGNINRLQ
jgi:hypothetical protein